MAIKFCTADCKNLRSLRYGFGGERVVGKSYDRRDRFATCSLLPAATITVAVRPECLLKREG